MALLYVYLYNLYNETCFKRDKHNNEPKKFGLLWAMCNTIRIYIHEESMRVTISIYFKYSLERVVQVFGIYF